MGLKVKAREVFGEDLNSVRNAHVRTHPGTPEIAAEETTATIFTLSCVPLLVIFILISRQVFQFQWNIRKQEFHMSREGGDRNTDLQRPGK